MTCTDLIQCELLVRDIQAKGIRL
ncbi:hypothetical protein HMPREF9248_1109 [Fannyhessea vaginae PB189-T1-4]|uniref:Uncharacterized protein n=1 Tax=Fannyhessea vaginae PB189-T1-4 TaxID=866774 RepID=A0ABN0B156_9ACTN|nr:hypothetical protein HMPREF9248_1109 [Fannyhessea vaginae PB189-T1-4]